MGELVFVYGTLRRGASDHFRMRGAECIGRAVVKGRLYRVSWYPGLVLDDEGGEVPGEVYRVSAAHLEALDAFEGCHGGEDDEFRRRRVGVEMAEGEAPGEVWIWEYRGEVRNLRRIAGAGWPG